METNSTKRKPRNKSFLLLSTLQNTQASLSNTHNPTGCPEDKNTLGASLSSGIQKDSLH